MNKFKIFLIVVFYYIIFNCYAQYDFNAFVSKFQALSLPIESYNLLNFSLGNPMDNNTVDYFVFMNHKTSQYGERPQIIRNNILEEQIDFGSGNGKFYPVGRINLHPKYISLIAKDFSGQLGIFGLYNFTLDGKCLSAITLSKYGSEQIFFDSVSFVYTRSEILKDGTIKWNDTEYGASDVINTSRTYKLRDGGYFEVIKEYIKCENELMAVCDKTSSYYNANSCSQTVCDRSHPNYNSDSCTLSRCNPSSPNYDATICSQVCKLNTTNYNCKVCQHQMISPGTPQYNAHLKTFGSYLAQGQPLQAASYFFNNHAYYLYGISYTLTYNASFAGAVRVTGGYGTAMQFEIGTGFNANAYLNSLCSELQLNINKAVELFHGTYNLGQNYGDFIVYAHTILMCSSQFEPSPYLINVYYGKMMGSYYLLSAIDQANLKSTADGVTSYYNYNRLNLLPANTKCK